MCAGHNAHKNTKEKKERGKVLTDKQIADQRNAGHATHLNDPAQSLSLSFLFLTPHLPPPPPPSLSITHSLLLTHPHTLVQNSVIGY